jgi:hypothetical protein
MPGTYKLKIIGAQQGKTTSNFKNANEKLLKTKAAICFNKICRIDQLAPKSNDICDAYKHWGFRWSNKLSIIHHNNMPNIQP